MYHIGSQGIIELEEFNAFNQEKSVKDFTLEKLG
jgi:hypothetical protein